MPDGILVPHLDLTFVRASGLSPQVGSITTGMDVGFRGYGEFDARFAAGFDGIHSFLGNFGLRAFGTKAAQIRIDAGLGAWIDARGDGPGRFAMQPTMNVPIWIHLGQIARIETGIGWSAWMPLNGERPTFSLATLSPEPTLLEPAVPLGILFQPFDIVYLGASTGFGMRALARELTTAEIVDGIFMPLDFRVGGTFSSGSHPIADVTATFAFPYALDGADTSGFHWQVFQLGFGVKVFIQP
jgi:hypothetical protein